jgi:hypothetical protein
MPQISTTHRRHSLTRTFVALIVLLFPGGVAAAAVPVADYQKHLKEAITALETLFQRDQDESASDFESRLTRTIEAVRVVLPEHQTVEFEGDVSDVDNSWLHERLDELKQSNADQQHEKITRILETLQALEARVGERQNPGGQIDGKDDAKRRLESILARPEYATSARGPNALARLIQDFLRWFQKLFPKPRSVEPGRAVWFTRIAQFVVFGGALALLIYVVRLLLMRVGRSRQTRTRKKREARIVLGERLEPDATSADLLYEAEALARSGDLRAAIRKAYIALLVELGDRKLIALAHHKTNRDYLNSLRSVPQLHSKMRGLTESFERHWYGFAQATSDDWTDFRAGYVAALQNRS